MSVSPTARRSSPPLIEISNAGRFECTLITVLEFAWEVLY